MPAMFESLITLGVDVVPAVTLAYGALITTSAMTALCARSKDRRRDALAVLRTLLLRKNDKSRR